MPTLWPAAKYSSSDGPIKAADRFLLRTTGIAGIGPKEAAATRPTLLVSTRKRAQTIRREAKTLQVQSALELSRWRDGRCCMGFPRALLSV